MLPAGDDGDVGRAALTYGSWRECVARRVPDLDADEHRRVARAIKNAREMALLPYPTTRR